MATATRTTSEKDSSNKHAKIELDTSMFQVATKHYLEECKPDPLAKRQVENLQLQWTNVKEEQVLPTHPKAQLDGILELTGDHMSVQIRAVCSWSIQDNKQDHGQLHFSLSVSGVGFLTTSQIKKRHTNEDASTTKQQDRIATKIHAGIVSRLKRDDYIGKLQQQSLCVAVIEESQHELEERVSVNQDVAEGIRRALFSHSSNTLDVLEFLCQMPWLHADKTTTRLSNRAKLRLLEDAMVDACELEDQDAMLQDLQLSKKHKT